MDKHQRAGHWARYPLLACSMSGVWVLAFKDFQSEDLNWPRHWNGRMEIHTWSTHIMGSICLNSWNIFDRGLSLMSRAAGVSPCLARSFSRGRRCWGLYLAWSISLFCLHIYIRASRMNGWREYDSFDRFIQVFIPHRIRVVSYFYHLYLYLRRMKFFFLFLKCLIT